MASQVQIGGLQKTTLIDYPGRVAATVFLMGCNFRCPFCYSSELVIPSKIKKQPKLSSDEFFGFLKERKDFLEGIVVCGGEPTLNPDLPDFIGRMKEMGYLVKLDTNGSNPQVIQKLLDKKQIDFVAMDVKAPKERYAEVVRPQGIENIGERIDKSIKILKNSDIDFEFRTTVVPGLLDRDDILAIANWIKPAPRYFLQNFRGEKTIDPKFQQIKPYTEEYLLDIQKRIAPFFETCQIR